LTSHHDDLGSAPDDQVDLTQGLRQRRAATTQPRFS
jgi:hypothetical protein